MRPSSLDAETMSIPLNEKKHSEAPLIAFTLCTPAAVGVAALAALLGFRTPGVAACLLAAASLALATVGMLASIFHLAKPLRAPFSLRHLSSSWLSREIVAVAAFWLFDAAWLLGCLLPDDAVLVAGEGLAATSGVALLFVITRAYHVPTRPAWTGVEGLLELVAAACGAGSGVVLLCLFGSLALEGLGAAPSATSIVEPALFAARLATLCAAQIAAFALDVASHRLRRARLAAMAEASDERIPLTLANYDKLRPMLRKAWTVEGMAAVSACIFCAVAAIHAIASPETVGTDSLFAPNGSLVAMGICLALASLQFAAHGLQRWLFYEIPVPVRFVAALRK